MASPVRTPAAAPESARRPPATAAPAVRLSAPPGVVPASLPAPVREAVVDTGGGAALSPEVSGALRRGLGVDPSPVRVHTDARAAAATTHLGVRAFTWGSHVYLGPGERADDVGLLAHEVAHAIQQSGGAAVQLFDGPHGALEAEAHSAAGTVVAGRSAQVRGRTSGPVVQGLFDWAARGLRAVGGAIASAASAVADVGAALRDRVMGFIKEHARSIPGYDLLGFILGRDPITQQPVERNAINLIRGILGLIPGGAAIFENLQKANVIQRAYDWFSAEITKLNITWPYIRGLFSQAWDALSITDLASPSGAWEKLKNIFGPPLARIGAFALAAGRKVLEFVFEGALALAGSAGQQILAIFRRIGAVFSLIVADPLKFLGNLLSAVKGGFGKFKDNIVAHLRTGLFEWLLGSLEGVTLPKTWDFAGILHLVLEILGLTYTALRGVLVKLIGEPAVAAVEKVFEFLVLVVTKGLGAAWDKIKEFATDLADQVVSGIRDWVTKSVVGAAVTKLVTLFNPVGAIIQGIITIYNTVMFFIERAQQIARLVNAVLDSVENIARGNLSGAIAYVEKTMANALPVILGFLARLLGLGNVTKYVRDIITKIRTTIAGALEKVGLWIKDKVKGLLAGKQDTQSAQVKARARELLQQRLPKAKDRPQAEQVIRQVASELRPQGLRRLEITGEKPDKSAVISAEASSFTELMAYLFGHEQTAFGHLAVRMITRLTLRGTEAPFPAFPEVPGTTPITETVPGQPAQVRFVAMEPTKKLAVGGVVARPQAPAPGARSTEVFTGTYNTAEDAKPCDNRTHAEFQFAAWLSRQGPEFLERVTHIDVEMFPLSPCRNCAKTLTDALGLFAVRPTARLRYGQLYVHSECGTTPAVLQGMTGWIVSQR